jgi:hypothetical protein
MLMYILTLYLTFYLSFFCFFCGILPETYSDVLSDNLSGMVRGAQKAGELAIGSSPAVRRLATLESRDHLGDEEFYPPGDCVEP